MYQTIIREELVLNGFSFQIVTNSFYKYYRGVGAIDKGIIN